MIDWLIDYLILYHYVTDCEINNKSANFMSQFNQFVSCENIYFCTQVDDDEKFVENNDKT